MPRATAQHRQRLTNEAPPSKFDLAHLFPDHPAIRPRGPLPKQRLVFHWLRSGAARGGGVVYQGSYGCAKTLTGASADISMHQLMPGLRSVVGRETYPSLMTSTYDEYAKMLEKVPSHFITRHSRPSYNSAGFLEWHNGGVTMFISLSNSDIWASANLGMGWVDEGHLQNPKIIEKLTERMRQDPEAHHRDAMLQLGIDGYPGAVLITSNPAGHSWFFKWASPKSKVRRPNWHYIEASMYENPALPQHYKDRLLAKFPPGTLAHKRWVLGKATQLEGAAFGDIFDPDPAAMVHVVPDHELPGDYIYGRGIDWGVDHPTVCIWGAMDPGGSMWIYRMYMERQLAASAHARNIRELEAHDPPMRWRACAPDAFKKVVPVVGQPRVFTSVAEDFRKGGVDVMPANWDRAAGFNRVTEMLTVDWNRIHPCTLREPAPRLFFLNVPSLEPLFECLESIQRADESSEIGKDDVKKSKGDDPYDALRYLLMATKTGATVRKPKTWRSRVTRRGNYRGYS